MGAKMTYADVPPDWEASAGEPLDTQDGVLIQRIADLYDAVDPLPGGLVERLQFAISLDALNAELAELQQQPLRALSARGAETSEVKTLTFTSDSLTTMVTISAAGPDRVRIDGWVAPGAGVTVELRQLAGAQEVDADADGRFVFEDVPHGLTRFFLRAADASRPPVITPAVEI
jgi:hypothetical protein